MVSPLPGRAAPLSGTQAGLRQRRDRILAINVLSKRGKSLRYLEKNPVDLDILYDTKDQVSKAYGIIRLPTIVLIDREGEIMNRWEGTKGLLEAKRALALHIES